MNSFGSIFKVQIYGESHGAGVGVIIDGVPAGIEISLDNFLIDLDKRKAGSIGTTKRSEKDFPHIISGIFNNFTTGSPINIYFKNGNTDSKVYTDFKSHPRPGHADFSGTKKFKGFNDIRGGGHFSGRLTLALVSAGVVAKKILNEISFDTMIESIGTLNFYDFEENLDSYLNETIQNGDSLGGVINLDIMNVPVGLGEPFFESIESKIASILFSVPGVKGIEFGAGFEGTKLFGSEFNDIFIDEFGTTLTNNNGGINGGISNGNMISLSVAIKPTASIFKSQETFNFIENKVSPLEIKGRHDVAFILRTPIVIENAAAIALADLFLIHKALNK